MKSYPVTCAEAALSFRAQCASHIHAVDLDGAKSGNADNAKAVKSIISATDSFEKLALPCKMKTVPTHMGDF